MKKRKQYILWLLSVCVAANGTAGLAAGSDVLPRDEILADETGEAWGTIPEEEIAGALAEIDIHVIDIMNENEKTGKAETDAEVLDERELLPVETETAAKEPEESDSEMILVSETETEEILQIELTEIQKLDAVEGMTGDTSESEQSETETAEVFQSGDFLYSVSESSARIVGYQGEGGVVTIPDKIGDYTVTAIGDAAFAHHAAVTGLIIPETVTALGCQIIEGTSITSITIPPNVSRHHEWTWHSPLKGCETLEEIRFADGTTKITDYIAAECSVKRIVFPESLKKIEEGAFYKCSSLSSVTFPESLSEIGVRAFSGCEGLAEVNMASGIVTIKESAFSRCTGLKKIVLGENVRYIERFAFSGCTNLKEILLNHNLEMVGDAAFEDTAATSITLPKSVTYLALDAMGNTPFSWRLEEIIFEEGTTIVNGAAARGKLQLTRVVLPESVTHISSGSFHGCKKLSSVSLPENIECIEIDAFSESGLTEIELGDKVTYLGDKAFKDCRALKKVVLGKNVKTIGYKAFSGTAITSITIPKTVSSCLLSSNWGEGPDGPFSACKELKEMIFEDGMTEIPAYIAATGQYPGSITRIVIPATVTKIGDQAFQGCSSAVIYGIPGSYAEQYAKENGFSFQDAGEYYPDTSWSVESTESKSEGLTDGSKRKVAAKVAALWLSSWLKKWL